MTCFCESMAGDQIQLTAACLGNIWLFEHLQPAEVEALMEIALRKRYERGKPIFRQGDAADKMFLIKGGRVKLSKVMEDGREITIDIRKAGDFIGETLFGEMGEYPLTAWCLEPTLICGLTREGFEALVLQHPNIGLQVIKNLSRRLDGLAGRLGDMSVTHLEDRLYRILVNVAREHGSVGDRGIALSFPLTHEELGFLVGAHRVSITRAMKELTNAGLIRREGRRLILRPES